MMEGIKCLGGCETILPIQSGRGRQRVYCPDCKEIRAKKTNLKQSILVSMARDNIKKAFIKTVKLKVQGDKYLDQQIVFNEDEIDIRRAWVRYIDKNNRLPGIDNGRAASPTMQKKGSSCARWFRRLYF
jgi:phage FluMu protein Com